MSTLLAYLRHRKNGQNTIYTLTCRNVVDLSDISLRTAGFATASSSITCPAENNHSHPMDGIQAILDFREGHTPDEFITLDQPLNNINKYNIEFSNVLATSGAGRILPDPPSLSDRALISITNTEITPANKLCSPYSILISWISIKIK